MQDVLFPSELPDVERVLRAKLRGIWLQADMGMTKHVDYIVRVGNRRTCESEKTMSTAAPLRSLFDAWILFRVLYASPGYFNAADIDSLQRPFIKAKQIDGKIVSGN